MIELKGLEEWARGILATSISALNRRYGTWIRSDEFSKSIEALPFYTRYRPVFCQISEPTLRELHQKLRDQKCEDNFWDAVGYVLDHSLPDDIAFDLIEREIAIAQLAHSPQSDAVLWRLTPFTDEPILTLAERAYTRSSRSLEEFQRVLDEAEDLDWVLQFVAQWSASSWEKRLEFEKAIENHPRREEWWKINIVINPDQQTFEHFALKFLSDSERIAKLYGTCDLEKLLQIARDDETPDVILHELELVREFPGATQVRAAARHTLRRREEMNEQWAIFIASNAEK